jgi:hypothetical protein
MEASLIKNLVKLPNNITLVCTDGTVLANSACLAAQSPVLEAALRWQYQDLQINARSCVVEALVGTLQRFQHHGLSRLDDLLELHELCIYYMVHDAVVASVVDGVGKLANSVQCAQVYARCVSSMHPALVKMANHAKHYHMWCQVPRITCPKCDSAYSYTYIDADHYAVVDIRSERAVKKCPRDGSEFNLQYTTLCYDGIDAATLIRLFTTPPVAE